MVNSIHGRLTLWYAAILGAILVAFSLVMYQRMAHGVAQATDATLQVTAQQIADALDFTNGRPELEAFAGEAPSLSLPDADMWLRVVDGHGQVLGGVGRYRDVPMPARLLDAAQQRRPAVASTVRTGQSSATRIYNLPFRADDGAFTGSLQVGEELSENERVLSQLRRDLLVGTGLGLVGACVSGLLLARRALAPIDQITSTMQQIKAHDLTQRLTLNLPDDAVGRLARIFNQLLARLEAAFERERQFTADAAHEWRTPLAVMKNEISVALNRPRSCREYHQVLVVLHDQVDRLTQLSTDLLLLARGDSHHAAYTREELDLSELLRAVTEQAEVLASTKGITFQAVIPPGLHVAGDSQHLARLVMNLLDNAIRYTAAGGQVRLVARPAEPRAGRGQSCRITVDDTGAGIGAEHLSHIFDRFYRGDQARNRAQGGAGLGLAIARQIAEAHGGTLAVRSAVGQGSSFVVTLGAMLCDGTVVAAPASTGA